MPSDMSPEMSTDDGPLIIHRRAGQPPRRVPRRLMGEFLEEVTRRVARGRGIVCLITNDGELRRLNRQFLGKDYATDVLSFTAGDGLAKALPDGRASKGRGSLGEIAISIDRAAAQAKEHGHSLGDELRILMLHGVLHLAGFDHEKDSGEMRDTETRWRKRFGLPAGLIERETARHTVQPRVQRAIQIQHMKQSIGPPSVRARRGRAQP
jgi:probable rRNA maturation factor